MALNPLDDAVPITGNPLDDAVPIATGNPLDDAVPIATGNPLDDAVAIEPGERAGLFERAGVQAKAAFFGVDQDEVGLTTVAIRDSATGRKQRRELGDDQALPEATSIARPGVNRQIRAIDRQVEQMRTMGREKQALRLEAKREGLVGKQQELQQEIRIQEAEFRDFEEGIRKEVSAIGPAQGALETTADFLGKMAASVPQAENLIPVSRGATVLRTFMKGAAAAATTNLLLEPGAQRRAIDRGVRDGYDPIQAAVNTTIGALVGGSFNALPHAVRQMFRSRNVKDAIVKAVAADKGVKPSDVTDTDIMEYGGKNPEGVADAVDGADPSAPQDPTRNIATAAIAEDTAGALDSTTGPFPQYQGNVRAGGEGKGRVGNLNNAFFGSDDELSSFVEAAFKTNNAFEEARFPRTDAEVRARAKEAGLTEADINKRTKGQAFNAEEILSTASVLIKLKDRLKPLTSRVANATELNPVSMQEMAEFVQVRAAFHRTLENFVGARGEAGRSLRILNQVAEAFDEMNVEGVTGALNVAAKGRGSTAVRNQAQALNDAFKSGDAARVVKQIEADHTPGVSDKLYEIWINSILSGPNTQIANITGNMMSTVSEPVQKGLAGAYDAIGAKITGRARTQFASEGSDFALGALRAMRDGLELGKRLWKSEDQSLIYGGKLENAALQRANKGRIGRLLRTPGRALMFADGFFQTINRRGEIAALANRQARLEGLSGSARQSRVGEIMQGVERERARVERLHDPSATLEDRLAIEAERKADPFSEGAARQIEQGTARARELTFTQELGDTGKRWQAVIAGTPGLRWAVPFVRTPTNLLRFAARRLGARSDLARVWRNRKTNPEAFTRALGEITFGQSMLMSGIALAQAGITTGSGPRDPAQRRVWLVNHQPYSIKMGDTWMSYRRFDPFSLFFALPADMYQLGKDGFTDKKMADGVVRAAAGFVVGGARTIMNRTWLTGISDLVSLLDDPSLNRADQIATRFGLGFVPFSAAFRQVGQMMDPNLRESTGVVNSFYSGIPVASKKVPQRFDVFGDPVMRGIETGASVDAPFFYDGINKILTDTFSTVSAGPLKLSPIQYQPGEPGKSTLKGVTANALEQAEAVGPRVTRKLYGETLTPEQFADYSRFAGQLFFALSHPRATAPGFGALPKGIRKRSFREAARTANRLGRLQMIGKYPELAEARALHGSDILEE